MFEEVLAELDAADIFSDTRHNGASTCTDIFTRLPNWRSLSLSLFCPLILLSSAMWRIPTCEDAGFWIAAATHSFAYTHSVSLTLSSTCNAHRVWGRAVDVGWGSENIILALQPTWSTAAGMIIAKTHYQKALIAKFLFEVSVLCDQLCSQWLSQLKLLENSFPKHTKEQLNKCEQ